MAEPVELDATCVKMYSRMMRDGGQMHIECDMHECKRLQDLYEQRLKYLKERNPALQLVREKREEFYELYEIHFTTKIQQNKECVEAAQYVLANFTAPQKRPNSNPQHFASDAFYMDFENSCLAKWDNSKQEFPKGRHRYKDDGWAEHILSNVYPHHSDIDWYEYIAWVRDGGGDDWFLVCDDTDQDDPVY